MITLAPSVDRLVEITLAWRVTAEEIEELWAGMRARVGPLPEVIFVCDFGALQVLGSDEAQRITAIMRSVNPNVTRSAVLLPRSAVAALQTERIVRSALNPRRRAFRTAADLYAWLDPILTPRELARTRAFLDGARAAGGEVAP